MVQIAIIEDNYENLTKLETTLKRYAEEKKLSFEIEKYSNANLFFESFSPRYDIIFMDIEMPGIDGVTASEKIRERDLDVVLIFVTNLLQYALKGYSVGALDYLLKPVKYLDLASTMNRALNHIKAKDEPRVSLNTKDGMRRISLNSIYYVEVIKHYLTFHTTDGDFVIRETIKNAESMLPDSFTRCNNCYLVNLRHVSFLDKEEVQVGPYRIRVSRRMYNSFFDALNKYLGK